MPSLASLPRARTIVLLSLPFATASLLATYFYNRPLPLTTPRKITTTRKLSPSCTAKTTSESLSIVNPHGHISDPDSVSIDLLRSETRGMSDEEILSRFLKGFFGGWSFLPERTYLSALGLMGRSFIPVGFSGVSDTGPNILSPNDLSMTKLPEKYSKLFHGNFMVLDVQIRDLDRTSGIKTPESISGSFVDIAFGDDRRGFAGFHRLEIFRDESPEREITLCYSSIACNPTANKLPLTGWMFAFHRWYGMCLFRDGVEMVLSNFGDDWHRIFDLFPELLMPGSAWENITAETRGRRNETIWKAAADARVGIDGLLAVLSGQMQEADADSAVKAALEWARRLRTSESEAHNYALVAWTDVLHRAFVIGFIVVEDQVSLRTGKVLIVFLDERGRSVREARCDAHEVNGWCPLWDEGAEFDGGQWEDGTIGEDYAEGGERWPITKGDVDGLMPLW